MASKTVTRSIKIQRRKTPTNFNFWRGLYREGNLRFKTDWASNIVGRKFTVFACFFFVFEGNFSSTSPRGAYNWRGDLTKGFLRYRFGGLIFGVAYTWRDLFPEFYGIFQ